MTIQDIGSLGLVSRVKGLKANRLHHLLSTLELNYFFILDWTDKVIDIKEQYPLNLEETIALAKEINVKHPPKNNPENPTVMTTDFVISVHQPIGIKQIARTIKYSTDLANERVLEKFEIERRYWAERKIDWGIVTELDINKTVAENLRWLYKYKMSDSLPPSINSVIIPELMDFLLPQIKQKKIALKFISKACDEKFNLSSGESLSFVRHLIATKKVQVDMFKTIQPEKILNFIHR